jgi:CelD/BcsL family acetyltransferase involved in cellulose biosynthesis
MASSFWHARPVPLWLNTPPDSDGASRDKARAYAPGGQRIAPFASSPFLIEAFGFETAAGIREEWADLVARSLEPNVFMEPGFALAAAQHLARANRPIFIAVWERESSGGRRRLLALWALLLSRRFFGARVATLWCHKQAALGLPLLDAARATETIAAVLPWLADTFPRLRIVVFPKLIRSGPTFARFLAHALDSGLEWRLLDQHARPALLASGAGPSLSKQTCQGLKRRRRQLERFGTIGVLSSSAPADIRNATEAFLALEEKGWKGRRRTALLCDSSRAAFARTMTRQLAREGKCRIDALTLDGRPIAMGIVLKSRGRAFFWKIAYEEAFAAQSPGVQLALEVTRIQQSQDTACATDSCTAPGNTMIERLWRDRLPIVDLALPLHPAMNEVLGGFAWRRVLLRRLSKWVSNQLRALRGHSKQI